MEDYYLAIGGVLPDNPAEEKSWGSYLDIQERLENMFPVPDYVKSMWHNFIRYGTQI